jgi:hypothetical protein
MTVTGELRSMHKDTCPSTASSSSKPPQTGPASKTGLRGERPVGNGLSHSRQTEVASTLCLPFYVNKMAA